MNNYYISFCRPFLPLSDALKIFLFRANGKILLMFQIWTKRSTKRRISDTVCSMSSNEAPTLLKLLGTFAKLSRSSTDRENSSKMVWALKRRQFRPAGHSTLGSTFRLRWRLSQRSRPRGSPSNNSRIGWRDAMWPVNNRPPPFINGKSAKAGSMGAARFEPRQQDSTCHYRRLFARPSSAISSTTSSVSEAHHHRRREMVPIRQYEA